MNPLIDDAISEIQSRIEYLNLSLSPSTEPLTRQNMIIQANAYRECIDILKELAKKNGSE